MSSPSHETFMTPDGATIAYTRHTSHPQQGPRLALIHSLALDRSIWDRVVKHLGTSADVVTYDCRGHGRSDRRAVPFTVDLFATDLAGLLDHVGWDRATIAGCSMGGCVAQAFAGSYPSRAERLALIDTTAWYGADARARWQDRAATARREGLAGLADFQATRWFSDAFRASRPEMVRHATEVFLANDVECYASTCGLLGEADLRPHLPGFTMPVAIIVGEDVYATPVTMARHLHEAIPKSSMAVLPHARHLTPVECPGELAAIIGELLRARDTRGERFFRQLRVARDKPARAARAHPVLRWHLRVRVVVGSVHSTQ
jgi:3-oxoadipate enol-lactonase